MVEQTTAAQQTPSPQASAARSAPEGLDDVISTTKTRGWWALIAIAGAIVSILVWSLVATIPQQVVVPAVISVDTLTTTVISPVGGQVTIKVADGAQVEKGQEIAAVTPFAGGKAVSITAPSAGAVSDIEVNEGQGVEPGTVITSVVRAPSADSGVLVTTFLPSAEAILFDVGAEVEVIVTDIETAKHSTVTATVKSVGVSPTNLESITAETGSPGIAADLSSRGGGIVYRVALELAPSADVSSAKVLPGEIVEVVNVYDDQRPIDLLFGGR